MVVFRLRFAAAVRRNSPAVQVMERSIAMALRRVGDLEKVGKKQKKKKTNNKSGKGTAAVLLRADHLP